MLHRALVSTFAIYLLATCTVVSANADIPRTADGKPDLNGVWQVLSRANNGLEAHAAQAAHALQPGPFGLVPAEEVVHLGAIAAVPPSLGVVDGGKIPYTAAGRAQKQENQKNWLRGDPEIKCYLPGVPRATYLPYPFQILHSDSAIFIAYEFAGAVRNLLLEDPGEAPVDSWMGQSYARWEGDTLVVEVTGQHGQAWLDRAGNHFSPQLKVTERYTLVNPHVIEYEATLEDPEVYTEPWTIRMPIYKRVGADDRLLQFKCVEFVEELLYGPLRKEPLNPDRRSPRED